MLAQLLKKAGSSLPTSYNPFPALSDRKYWDNISDNISHTYIKAAEDYLEFDFPILKASCFMEYYRSGNRSNYQKLYSHRRLALNVALLAEVFENKGRFIDLIIDMAWLMCEQTTWIIPAHNKVAGYQHEARPLPDYDRPIVALMSADIAASLALAVYFFEDEFNKVTPQITQRIKSELQRRILKPYRDHTDYWWMGFLHEAKEQLNNWNPWINSNVLMVLLLIEDNEEERYYQLQKLLESLDKYIAEYPDDGGCDEGPGYWGRAGASTFECLDILHDYSNGVISIYNEPKIKNMCKYIYKAHISGPYFVNFADAGPKAVASPSLIYRFSKSIGDNKGMAFGAARYQDIGENITIGRFGIIRPLHEALLYNEISTHKEAYTPEPAVFLPDIEVAFMRCETTNGELYAAVKGGNNLENHNHNDVGNFVIYGKGKPFIVDAGSMEYTKKTFSSQRYEIWTNCSRWHNTPEINGKPQICGRSYKASDVSFTNNTDIVEFSAQLQKAYEAGSGIKTWTRKVSMNNGLKQLEVLDSFSLESTSEDIKIFLMTLPKPEINGKTIILSNDETQMEINISEDFDAEYETIKINDEKMLKEWGENLYRIILKINKPQKDGNCKIICRLI